MDEIVKDRDANGIEATRRSMREAAVKVALALSPDFKAAWERRYTDEPLAADEMAALDDLIERTIRDALRGIYEAASAMQAVDPDPVRPSAPATEPGVLRAEPRPIRRNPPPRLLAEVSNSVAAFSGAFSDWSARTGAAATMAGFTAADGAAVLRDNVRLAKAFVRHEIKSRLRTVEYDVSERARSFREVIVGRYDRFVDKVRAWSVFATAATRRAKDQALEKLASLGKFFSTKTQVYMEGVRAFGANPSVRAAGLLASGAALGAVTLHAVTHADFSMFNDGTFTQHAHAVLDQLRAGVDGFSTAHLGTGGDALATDPVHATDGAFGADVAELSSFPEMADAVVERGREFLTQFKIRIDDIGQAAADHWRTLEASLWNHETMEAVSQSVVVAATDSGPSATASSAMVTSGQEIATAGQPAPADTPVPSREPPVSDAMQVTLPPLPQHKPPVPDVFKLAAAAADVVSGHVAGPAERVDVLPKISGPSADFYNAAFRHFSALYPNDPGLATDMLAQQAASFRETAQTCGNAGCSVSILPGEGRAFAVTMDAGKDMYAIYDGQGHLSYAEVAGRTILSPEASAQGYEATTAARPGW